MGGDKLVPGSVKNEKEEALLDRAKREFLALPKDKQEQYLKFVRWHIERKPCVICDKECKDDMHSCQCGPKERWVCGECQNDIYQVIRECGPPGR